MCERPRVFTVRPSGRPAQPGAPRAASRAARRTGRWCCEGSGGSASTGRCAGCTSWSPATRTWRWTTAHSRSRARRPGRAAPRRRAHDELVRRRPRATPYSSRELADSSPDVEAVFGRGRRRGPDRLRGVLLRRCRTSGRGRVPVVHPRARGRAGGAVAGRADRRPGRRGRRARSRQRRGDGPAVRRPGHPRAALSPRDVRRAGLAARAARPGDLAGSVGPARRPRAAVDGGRPGQRGRACRGPRSRRSSPNSSARARWSTRSAAGCAAPRHCCAATGSPSPRSHARSATAPSPPCRRPSSGTRARLRVPTDAGHSLMKLVPPVSTDQG